MSLRAVRYHDGERYTTALIKAGRTRLHAVVIDDCGVRVLSEPRECQRFCQPLLLRGQPYPIDLFVRQLRRVGRARGITAAAKAILAEAST